MDKPFIVLLRASICVTRNILICSHILSIHSIVPCNLFVSKEDPYIWITIE